MAELSEYHRKRDFGKTREPRGGRPRGNRSRGNRSRKGSTGRSFVVQAHDASSLHYDLRLELEGVLRSWAVPKGPSNNPSDKRLAVQVEDHPLDYRDFEGVIPQDEYGAGPVIVWDRGTWEPEGDGDPGEDLAQGELKFILRGEKLSGSWVLVKMKGRGRNNWLLIKHSDRHAAHHARKPLVDRKPRSVKSGRTLGETAALAENNDED